MASHKTGSVGSTFVPSSPVCWHLTGNTKPCGGVCALHSLPSGVPPAVSE